MNLRVFNGFAVLSCVLLASCYPYNEQRPQKKAQRGVLPTPPTAEELQLKKQEEERKKQEEELKKAEETKVTPPENLPNSEIKPTTPEKKSDYAFANKVPGKDGFVFSPYNNKVVDVRDIPSGTLVQDPTYPPSEKKYFRVP